MRDAVDFVDGPSSGTEGQFVALLRSAGIDGASVSRKVGSRALPGVRRRARPEPRS